MTVELYNEVRFKDTERISGFFPKVDVDEEFIEAVRDFSSYPKWYTLPVYYQECLELIWEKRCREDRQRWNEKKTFNFETRKWEPESPTLERNCIHAINCKKANNCKCSSLEECNGYDDQRAEQRRIDHNIKRKPKQNGKIERWNEERQKLEDLKWSLY
jgi:hypothetical protein